MLKNGIIFLLLIIFGCLNHVSARFCKKIANANCYYFNKTFFGDPISHTVDSLTRNLRNIFISHNGNCICAFKDSISGVAKEKIYKDWSQHYLQTYYDSGFASAHLVFDSLSISEQSWDVYYRLEKGVQYQYAAFEANGVMVQSSYFRYRLHLEPGAVFSITALNNGASVLKALPYMVTDSVVLLSLHPGWLNVTVFSHSQKGNRFSGLAAFGKNPVTGKNMITGQVNLSLNHLLERHERFDFNWDKSGVDNQLLKLEASYPFVFNLPVSLMVGSIIQRIDSLTMQQTWKGGLGFAQGKAAWIWGILGSTEAKEGNESEAVLSKMKFYGIRYQINRFDIPLNPRKGFVFDFSVNAGNKSLSDSLGRHNMMQYECSGNAALAFSWKNTTWYANFLWGIRQSEKIAFSEAYRLGGAGSFRGFSQQSLLASCYGVKTIEWRKHIQPDSYLFIFQDAGLLWFNETRTLMFSWGAGLNISVPAGILNLSYAIGKNGKSTMQFSQSKIHISYTALF